jgi:hypothetical protein
MNTIKLNKKIYHIPTSLDEVKLGTYQKILRYQTNVANLGLTLQSDLLDNKINILSILTRIPLNELYEISIDSLTTLNKSVDFLDVVPKKIQTKFTLGKKSIFKNRNTYREFNLIPDIKTMTTREYIDFDSLLKTLDTSGSNLDKVVAILFREKGVKYNTDNLNNKAKFMSDNIPTSFVLPAINFIIALV